MRISKAQVLASKQYISIIRLFRHCDIAIDEDFNLARAKKQLQAEFSIAQGGFVEVEGYTYNRNDIFQEIERPDFHERLDFHKMIWQSPQILQLLEKNTADLSTIGDEFIPFCGNDDFDNFFSPYFAGPFSYLSRTLLAQKGLREMGYLLGYEDFLQPAEREEAFRPIQLFLDETIRVLRNVKRENYKIMRPKIAHWIDGDWYLFLNHLPHEFYDKKIDITAIIVNIGVAVQRSHRRDCKKMSEQLISLQDTPESLRSIISSNHIIYTGSSGGSGWGGGWWVGVIIFILIKLAASDSCNNRSSNSIFTYPNEYQISDSVLKKLSSDSNFRIRFDTATGHYIPLKPFRK